MIKLNGEILEFTQFPNGETNVNGDQLRGLAYWGENVVELKYESDGDLVKLMFVKKYLDNIAPRTSSLTIAYMPYSRQDRVEGNSVFTLKYVAEFINQLGFTSVSIAEPHSDVTMALVDRSSATYLTVNMTNDILEYIDFNVDTDYLFYPDAGAAKRYSKLICGCKVLVGFKDRDFATGRIKSLEVVGDIPEPGFKVIIVDDLCSRGGTFVLAVEELKKRGASEVYLVVAHCENSIADGDILKDNGLITKVFTTDSILSVEHDKIEIFKGENL